MANPLCLSDQGFTLEVQGLARFCCCYNFFGAVQVDCPPCLEESGDGKANNDVQPQTCKGDAKKSHGNG